MNAQAFIALISILAVVFLVSAIIRGIVLWYFKIDEFQKMFKQHLAEQAQFFADYRKSIKEMQENEALTIEIVKQLKAQNKALQELILLQTPQPTAQVPNVAPNNA